MSKAQLDVMFYEVFSEEQEALQCALPSDIKAEFTEHTIQSSGHEQCPSELISIRTQSTIPDPWIGYLKGAHTRSTGYDHLVSYQDKVACGYLPKYCGQAVAEQAIWMMMCLLRRGKQQMGQWETFDRHGLTGHEAQNKNVLVVGVGDIGSKVAALAKGLGMQVKGVDLDHSDQNVEYISLDEGMEWAKVVVCCVPLNESTEAMLGYGHFHNGQYLINVSRAEVTPLADLSRLLDEGKLVGLALDVFPEEGILSDALRSKSMQDNELISMCKGLSKRDNVIFTPHNAFNSFEALEKKASLSVQAIQHFLEKGSFPLALA